jgi:uncharacterized protein (TIGR03437 family)
MVIGLPSMPCMMPSRAGKACRLVLAFASAALAQVANINITITSAASFQVGVPAKGSIAAIFCTGLTHLTGLSVASGAPLPYELEGVQVWVGGAPAPIFAVGAFDSFQLVNVQIPLEAQWESSSQGQFATVRIVSVEGTGETRANLSTTPGDFFQFADGTGIFRHAADYSLVTNDNPAYAGEFLVGYLTGLPGALPPVATGQSAPLAPLSPVSRGLGGQEGIEAGYDRYFVTFNGTRSTPTFLGLNPGNVGVYEVDVMVPATSSHGAVDVSLLHEWCITFFGSCGDGGGVSKGQMASRQVKIPMR